MTDHHSDWIFNIGLKIAVSICLATLAVALFTGVGPLTAVFRSGAAFTVFVSLGWAVAVVWQAPQPTPKATDRDQPEGPQTDAAATFEPQADASAQ